MESTWPSLTYAGPSSTSRLRNATARSGDAVAVGRRRLGGFLGREVDRVPAAGEVAQAVAREQPDGRGEARQVARREDHAAEQAEAGQARMRRWTGNRADVRLGAARAVS